MKVYWSSVVVSPGGIGDVRLFAVPQGQDTPCIGGADPPYQWARSNWITNVERAEGGVNLQCVRAVEIRVIPVHYNLTPIGVGGYLDPHVLLSQAALTLRDYKRCFWERPAVFLPWQGRVATEDPPIYGVLSFPYSVLAPCAALVTVMITGVEGEAS